MQPLLGAVYNLNNNSYRQLAMFDGAFCGAHLMLYTGQVAVIGGSQEYANPVNDFYDGRFNIRIFAPGPNPTYTKVNTMVAGPNYPNNPRKVDSISGGRWYPSVLTMPDGRVMITSGVVTASKLAYSPWQMTSLVTQRCAWHAIEHTSIVLLVGIPIRHAQVKHGRMPSRHANDMTVTLLV